MSNGGLESTKVLMNVCRQVVLAKPKSQLVLIKAIPYRDNLDYFGNGCTYLASKDPLEECV